MRTVFVNPERCIGCKQCEVACSVAHSQSKNLFLSVFETPLPKPRIHAEPGLALNSSFPNKCRHCDPAPCLAACPTGAIYRAHEYPDTVLLDVRRCIACGMCAIVCPFAAITYYADAAAPDREVVALKCDNCISRRQMGQIPACAEACKTGALQFGEVNEVLKETRTRYARQLLARVPAEADTATGPPGIRAWRTWGETVTRLNANGHKGAK